MLRVCGWLYTVCAGISRPGGDVNSEMAPLLVSPALRTLFGRLPRCAGDAAPPVVTDPGRLSPTRLLIRDSISRRLSARAGAGEINCVDGQQGRPGVGTPGWGAPDIAAAETLATWSILGGAKLSLALELCELRLLRENLVPALLHCGCGVLPFNSPFPGFSGSSIGR